MSKYPLWLSRVSVPFLVLTPLLSVADDPSVNRLLAAQCAQCHGTNGYAKGEFDELAGEEAKDLFEDLADMKGEDKPKNIMDHQALGYTDDQIRRIASFYAALPEEEPGGSSQPGDPEEPEEPEEPKEPEDDESEEDEEH